MFAVLEWFSLIADFLALYLRNPGAQANREGRSDLSSGGQTLRPPLYRRLPDFGFWVLAPISPKWLHSQPQLLTMLSSTIAETRLQLIEPVNCGPIFAAFFLLCRGVSWQRSIQARS